MRGRSPLFLLLLVVGIVVAVVDGRYGSVINYLLRVA